MKKLILIIIIIVFSSNAFSLKFQDENLDGFWTVNSPLMLKENPDNKELNSPLRDFFKRMYGSIVFYIKGNNGIYFIGGESKKDEIIITEKDKDKICFKLNYKKSPEFCKFFDGPELWLFLETKSDTILIPFKRDYDSDLNKIVKVDNDDQRFILFLERTGNGGEKIDCIVNAFSSDAVNIILSKFDKLELLRGNSNRYKGAILNKVFSENEARKVKGALNDAGKKCR